MLDFEVQRCTRHCAETERAFAPGESFFAVLQWEDGQMVRRDYSVEAWKGPPDDAIGWWKAQMPEATAKQEQWAPDQVLINCFEQMATQPEQAALRYVLTLLLIRRRLFKLDDEHSDADLLRIHCALNDTDYEVTVAVPEEEQIGEIQQRLSQLLYAQSE